MCVHQTLYPMPFNSWRTPAQKKTSCSTHIFWHVLWVGLNTELCWVSIYSTPPCNIKQKAKEYWHRQRIQNCRGAVISAQRDLKKNLSLILHEPAWQRLEHLWCEGTMLLYCYIYPWSNGIWSSLKCKQWKRGHCRTSQNIMSNSVCKWVSITNSSAEIIRENLR